jgi:hypothetical protein
MDTVPPDPDLAAFHLAQVNLATLRAPLDSPELAGFVAQLEPVNALADQSPGFVWRLQTEDGDATAIRPFEDDRVIVNLSVWASLEALRSFVYASRHLDVMRQRLELLARRGPTAAAFTFRAPFPEPADATR